MTRHLLLLSPLLLTSLAASAVTTVNSASTKFTVYGLWLSPNADCSSPVQVSSSTSGTVVDVTAGGTLGTGSIAAGTYKCLILEVNSVISYVPATSDGGQCVAGTSVSYNTCIVPNSTVNTSKDPTSGATINCTGTASTDLNGDKVFIYVSENSICSGTLSTNPSCNGVFTNAFQPPTKVGDAANGFMLSGDIVVSANTTAHFVFDTDNQIDTDAGVCDLEGFTLTYK